MTSSVGSELLNEIDRVAAKRERWRGYQTEVSPQGNLAPAILLMTMAIERGKQAAQSGDVADSIAALRELKGFDSND